ncbi:hypothetical protein HH562_004539 [Salmonella enterica subsp. enterica serovar Yaba]|nr:hypothetical protein [Salmonella enterica subsp. enterica serovar Yaba]
MIKASLTIFNKKNPIISGYRPLFYINEMFYSGVITFDGVICPLETRSVNVEFVTFDGELNNGDVIKLFESPKHEIGEAVICKD